MQAMLHQGNTGYLKWVTDWVLNDFVTDSQPSLYLHLDEKPSSFHIQQGLRESPRPVWPWTMKSSQLPVSCHGHWQMNQPDNAIGLFGLFHFFLPSDDIWLFFLIHKLCLLSLALWHFLPYHTHSLILKKVTKDSFALCLWRFSIMESIKEVPDKLNITDIQNLKPGMCWEDFKKNRCRQEDWRGPVK